MIEINSSTSDTKKITSASTGRDWGALLAACIAAVTLLGVGWLEKIAWEKLAVAESTIKQAHSSSLSSGMKIQESLSTLKLALLLFQVSGGDENRQSFSLESRRLTGLAAEAEASVESPEERAILKDIQQSLKNFIAEAEDYVPLKAIRRGSVAALSQELDTKTEPIAGDITKLVTLQVSARDRLLAESAQAFRASRAALKSSLIALALLLGAVALLVHRAIVVPLQNRLDATAAESVRHEKLASIGVLATGVAHEIRNPLTAIKFRLFSLKKALGPGLSDNEDYQTVKREIDRLENIVKNFLEFARPAEPRWGLIISTSLLQDVQQFLEPEMTKRKISIAVDAPEELEFEGDKQQLRQVLINLAQNAGDCMPDGGTITFRSHSGVVMLANRRQPAILLDVIDTGPGIEPEVQKRLFDPFFSTKEGGTGLGLAIAERIVEQHGGIVQFSTRKNHGSTFTMVLPKKNSHAEITNPPDRG